MPDDISLDAFRAAVADGDGWLEVTSGGTLEVVATRRKFGRSVTWVRNGAGADPQLGGLFIEALGRAFGEAMAADIAGECDVRPDDGKPLATRAVRRALDMAAHRQGIYQGMNFLTRLQFAARGRGPEFLASCAAAGVAPGALAPRMLDAIDARFGMLFDQAADGDRTFVDLLRACALMRQTLGELGTGQLAEPATKSSKRPRKPPRRPPGPGKRGHR